MSRIPYIIGGLALLLTAACGDTEKADVTTNETEFTAEAGHETLPQSQQSQYATLNAGTIIPVRLQDPLDSSVNQTGDLFRASVDEDLMVENSIVVPRNSLVEGELAFVERTGKDKGSAAMSMHLYSMNIGNNTYALQTEMLSMKAEGTQKKDAAKEELQFSVEQPFEFTLNKNVQIRIQ